MEPSQVLFGRGDCLEGFLVLGLRQCRARPVHAILNVSENITTSSSIIL